MARLLPYMRLSLLASGLGLAFVLGLATPALAQTDSTTVASTPVTTADTAAPRRYQRERYFEVAGLAMAYKGSMSKSYRNWHPGVQFGLVFNQNKRFNGSFHGFYGLVTGAQPAELSGAVNSNTANTYFSSTVLGAYFRLRFNIIKRERFTLYVSQGLGFMRFNPKDASGTALSNQNRTRAAGETYNNVCTILPTTLGVAYVLPNQWQLNFQAGWLSPTTDYLDNVGKLASDGYSARDRMAVYQLGVWLPLKVAPRPARPARPAPRAARKTAPKAAPAKRQTDQ